MAIDLQALKDELTLDPVSMSYLALIEANDVANANIINNNDGNNPRTVNNDTILTSDLVGETTFDAYDGLTASETSYYDMITNRELIAVTPDTLVNLAGVGGTSKWQLGDRPTMEPRITALMQFQGSRAQEIKDTLGVSTVTPTDVRNARSL
jgi:hypothetical protein